MDDFELPQLNPGEWIAAARRDFPSFYARATPEDLASLNHLVIAHATLVMLPRSPVSLEGV